MLTRINVGPIHPSTHGVLRLVVTLDGDTIVDVEPHIGFLHRGVEKLAENRMYMQNEGYMEKIDYAAPMAYSDLYVSAVELAMGVHLNERAKYARLILLELQRIASHLLWLGTYCNDLGQMFTMFMWTMKDRDLILNLLQDVTGSRMFYVNMRIGGLSMDLPPNFEEHATKLLDYLEKRLKEYESFLEKNPIFIERTKGVGVLKRKDAIELGVTGPVLRASGVNFDVRKDYSYYAYDRLHFMPQIQIKGDAFARYKVRMLEMKESIRLIREALKEIPEGDALGMPIKLISPPIKESEVIVKRELPRGEGMIFMVTDKQKPYRLSIRAPAFINLSALRHIAKGARYADLFSILGSLDLVMADVDR
ncbi:MAG: NADH-quinone oxidoreductase subunit D [Candidatus Micrarchaeia archaeon]|jgi:NADH-quinone oxidoreductase subunit D